MNRKNVCNACRNIKFNVKARLATKHTCEKSTEEIAEMQDKYNKLSE